MKLYTYFPRWVKLLPWVLTVLMVPAAIAVFFFEGQDLARFFVMVGAAFVFPGLLWGMLEVVERFIQKKCWVEIEGDVMKIYSRLGETIFQKGTVEKLELRGIMKYNTNMVFTVQGETKKILMPGVFRADAKSHLFTFVK